MKALSKVGFVGMVAGILGLIATRSLFSPSPVVIAFQAVAFAGMVWARLAFGRRSFHAAADPTEGGLVTTGPYRIVRHPIYASVVLFALAGAAAHPSPAPAGFALVVLAGALARITAEERLVRIRYPEYDAYAARVKRLVPFLY